MDKSINYSQINSHASSKINITRVKAEHSTAKSSADGFSVQQRVNQDEFRASIKGLSPDAVLAKASSHNLRLKARHELGNNPSIADGAPPADQFVMSREQRAARYTKGAA